MSDLSKARVTDRVLSNIILGYGNGESISQFVAPVVPVTLRSGKIVKFTKEQFAVVPTKRSPGAVIQRVSSNYTSENYSLNQHTIAGVVTEEEYEEAINSDAKIDLRKSAALRASQVVSQSWEQEVISTVTNASLYETNNTAVCTGTGQFSHASADIEAIANVAKEAVRSQIGVYPNSALISPRVFNAIKNNPIFRDKVKYTSSSSITLEMIAAWLDLPRGIKVASKVYLDASGNLVDFMGDNALFFYAPDGPLPKGFEVAAGADKAIPAFAYTYTLQGYPLVAPERYDADTRSYVTDVISEQAIIPTGLGSTGKIGAGFLYTDCLA